MKWTLFIGCPTSCIIGGPALQPDPEAPPTTCMKKFGIFFAAPDATDEIVSQLNKLLVG